MSVGAAFLMGNGRSGRHWSEGDVVSEGFEFVDEPLRG